MTYEERNFFIGERMEEQEQKNIDINEAKSKQR
jgi:hypothetical protein